MQARSVPFPLPERLVELSPALLSAGAVSSVHRVYGTELDDTPESLSRLDGVIAEHLRPGKYTAEDYPAALALTMGAYVGVVLLRHLPEGKWGSAEENLYATPLPFLAVKHEEQERQINVVEEVMHYLWSGQGLPPRQFFDHHTTQLARLGFVVTA